jgi:hypothetical protein
MEPYRLPVCPKCKQSDQIQKVSALYGMNTKEWTETSTSIDAWGHTTTSEERRQAHTALGLKLKPPQQPSSPTHPGLWYGIGGFVVLFIGSILCPALAAPVPFLLLPLFGLSAFAPEFQGAPDWQTGALILGGVLLCLVSLGLAAMGWVLWRLKKRYDADLAKFRARKAAYERDDLPRWQRARRRWEQLHFCLRDETLFLPDEGRTIPLEEMEQSLYRYWTGQI